MLLQGMTFQQPRDKSVHKATRPRSGTGVAMLVLAVSLVALFMSCKNEQRSLRRDEGLAAQFERMRKSLAVFYDDRKRPVEEVDPGQGRVGCFISETGAILTAAHAVPTTHPVLVIYQSDAGSSRSVVATAAKYNREMDLAVLRPEHPIRPAKFLEMDLDASPVVGREIALLTMIRRQETGFPRIRLFPTIFPRRVVAVFPDGLLASDMRTVPGMSGSPAVDLVSERVIGVCVSRGSAYDYSPEARIPVPMPDGTTFSLPALGTLDAYGLFRSTFSARDFLRDSP